MNPIRKVQPGEAHHPSAALHNAVVDLIQQSTNSTFSSTAPDPNLRNRAPDCWVKNTSAQLMPQFSPAAIQNVVFTPDKRGFFSTPTLQVNLPAGSETVCVVAAEPVKAGRTGPAWLMGLVPATIEVSDAGHAFAKPKAGQFVFESATSGWPIIWKQAGTGTKFGYVLIGAIGGSVAAEGMQLVLTTGTISAAVATTGTMGTGNVVDVLRDGAELLESDGDPYLVHNPWQFSIGPDKLIGIEQWKGTWVVSIAECDPADFVLNASAPL